MLEENPLTSLLGMLVVIVLVLVLAWWATKQFARHAPQGFGNRTARDGFGVLAQLPLGQGQRIVVVECAERYFLLGVTEQSISTLAELSDEDAQRWKHSAESAAAEQGAAPFAALLQNRLRR